MSRLLPLLLALLPAVAAAHSASVDATAGRLATSQGPSTLLAVNVAGSIELRPEELLIDVGYTALRDDTRAVGHLALLGCELILGDHLSVEAIGTFSPPKKFEEALLGGALHSESWNAGLLLAASWDSFVASDFETVIDAAVGATQFGVTRETSQERIRQLRLTLGVTETIHQVNDVTLKLGGAFFDGHAAGAPFIARGAQPVGTILATAPLRLDGRLGYTRRFGALAATVNLALGRTVEGGALRAVNGRVSFSPTPTLRLFLSGTAQPELDAGGAARTSVYGGGGVELRFE